MIQIYALIMIASRTFRHERMIRAYVLGHEVCDERLFIRAIRVGWFCNGSRNRCGIQHVTGLADVVEVDLLECGNVVALEPVITRIGVVMSVSIRCSLVHPVEVTV